MSRVPVVALAALMLSACTPELNWRELRADEAGLVQMFPCKPVRQQRKVRLADRDLSLVLQVCDAGGVTWALTHADVRDPGAVSLVLEALVAAAHANLGAMRQAARPHPVAGATPNPAGGRFELTGQAPDGRSLQAAVLVFARGTGVVQLTALGATLPAGAVDTFMASVRVT